MEQREWTDAAMITALNGLGVNALERALTHFEGSDEDYWNRANIYASQRAVAIIEDGTGEYTLQQIAAAFPEITYGVMNFGLLPWSTEGLQMRVAMLRDAYSAVAEDALDQVEDDGKSAQVLHIRARLLNELAESLARGGDITLPQIGEVMAEITTACSE